MSLPARRAAAAAALAVIAALTAGCTRIEADIEVRADGMIEVDASYWLPPGSDGYPDPCVWFHRQGISGLEVAELRQGMTRRGCRASGVTSAAALESRHLVARQQDGTWEFTFRPRTRLWPAATAEGLDERIRDFDVVVRFPGRVESANPDALVDGSTVRWTRASTMLDGLTASAAGQPNGPDWPVVSLGLAAALGAGALGGWLWGRRPSAVAASDGGDGTGEGGWPADPPVDHAEDEPEPPSAEEFFARPVEPEDPSVWAPGSESR